MNALILALAVTTAPACALLPGPSCADAPHAPRLGPTSAAPADTSPVPADIALGVDLLAHGLTAPLRWSVGEWLLIPASAIVLGGVITVDGDIEDLARSSQGPVGDAYFGALEPFGEYPSAVLVAGIYAGGLVLDRPAWRRTAVEAAASSVIASGIVTPSLKLIFGRVRPRDGPDEYAFDPFSGHYSFPSGHTTQAFAVASVLAAESESAAVDALFYGAAASVGLARIYHDAHFLSDVLAGAAIGTVVGHAMVRRGRELTGSAEPWVGVLGDRVVVGLRLATR